MKRRDFIKLSAFTALALVSFSENVYASEVIPKTVINISLDGGPDFRHLIVPAFSSEEGSYGLEYAKTRASIFDVAMTNEALQANFDDHYDAINISGVDCGILKSCEWLKDEINAQNVAIINNAIASTNRDHHHSILILESGSLLTGSHDVEVSGWLGRGAKALNAHVVSVSSGVRLVCNGPHATDAKAHDNSVVISNTHSRNAGLYNYDTQADLDSGSSGYKYNERAILSRSLSSYYSAKRDLIDQGSPYEKFMKHEEKLRLFGDQLKARLDTVALPQSIINLYEGENTLSSKYFGRQIRSLYDSFASQDILSMRYASLEYTGWDSHKHQRAQIEAKYSDMFGAAKGLATLQSELELLNSGINDGSVIIISGEFGRQLKSNGDNGTDHGRGNSVLVIGKKINGGFYGDPFPSDEIDKLSVKNEDITGKTSIFQIYARVLEWQEAGLGESVFDLSAQAIEDGVDFSNLLS